MGVGARMREPATPGGEAVAVGRRLLSGGLMLALGLCLGAGQARGQGTSVIADDIISSIIAKGERAREQDFTHLGALQGRVERPFEKTPGADAARLGERLPQPRALDILSAAAREQPAGTNRADRRPGILPPALPEAAARVEPPLYGPIDLPAAEDEGPPGGLTLEGAIARLIQANPELAVKFQELPKAEADILTAGLYGNPLVLGGVDKVPYGRYSPQRPGSTGYSVSIVQPFDVNGKIPARVRLAQSSKNVLQAQYQDAVRLEVELLHAAWVDVLAARTTLGYLRTSLTNSEALVRTTQDQIKRGAVPETDLDTVVIQQETIANALEEAAARLTQTKRALAVLLGIPPAQADRIEVRGALRDGAAAAPPDEELVRLALCHRPDMAAYRLGVRSATANVEVQRRERFPDVFALYTPYGFDANNGDPGARGATSWGAGVFASVPLFNRNQGNIRRAEHTVSQTKIELTGLEQRVVAEVHQAALEYGKSRDVVRRFDESILPRARRMRDARYRLYTQGQGSVLTYLEGQRQFNEVVRQYLDALIRHRRDMLRLNTAVGQRILP